MDYSTKLFCILILFFARITGNYDHRVNGWDNGLARTPPMGWMSWLRFACNLDCDDDDDRRSKSQCIDDRLYRDMIDRIAADGYAEAGYNTVNIDDCWMEMTRDPATGRLRADNRRFSSPNGIAQLASYAHRRGLLLGIYEDVGTRTCAGYPGTRDERSGKDYTELDARTFADWRVDSLKLDGCYAEAADPYNVSYPRYAKALNKQSHKIVYACSWPAYQIGNLTDQDYATIREYCNYWRNFDDIMDSWQSVLSIIEFYRENVQTFVKYHGPGGWFDPDMLLIGNEGLSYEQSKSQMAFWSLWSAPLMMSNDLRTIKPEFRRILLNKHLIAIDQDPLGIMGHVVKSYKGNQLQVWVKKLSPPETNRAYNAFAVLYFNNQVLGVAAKMSFKLAELIPELKPDLRYDVYDLFDDNRRIDTLTADQRLTLRVPTSGSVRFVKLIPRSSNDTIHEN